MTSDHLKPVLDNIRDTHLLHQMGQQLATACIPAGIHGTLRLGRFDCIAEAARGRERNRRWGRYSQVGWPHNDSTT